MSASSLGVGARGGRRFRAEPRRAATRSFAAFAPPVIFALQAVALAGLSIDEVAHHALTWDFANIYQTWYLIAHGTPDPLMTAAGVTWLHDHSNLLIWPLAAFALVWDAPLALKLLQDAALVATCALAYAWACDIARERFDDDPRARNYAAFAALVLLAFNPWLYMSNAFDVHMYAFETLLLVALGRALYHRSTLWSVVFALCGAAGGSVFATIVAVTGGVFLVFGRNRAGGALAAAIGAGWTAGASALHLNYGDHLAGNYGYLAGPGGDAPKSALDVVLGIARHPAIALAKLGARASALYANLGPTGFLGLLCPFTAIPAAVVLLEDFLAGGTLMAYSAPGGQNLPVYPLLAVGFTWTLAQIGRVRVLRHAVPALATLGAANAALWFGVWYPQIRPAWVHVGDATVAQIDALAATLSPDDEVLATQGIVGGFAGRKSVYAILGGDEPIPLRARRTLALVTTTEGIEVASYEQRYGAIATLLATPGARLLAAGDRLWAFELDGPRLESLALPKTVTQLPAVVFATDAGRRAFGATPSVQADGTRSGYLVRSSLWRRKPGHYVARVAMTSLIPATVEVRDVHAGTTIATRTAIPGDSIEVPFTVRGYEAPPPYAGWLIFGYQPVAPPTPRLLEVRVRVEPGFAARVERIGIEEAA